MEFELSSSLILLLSCVVFVFMFVFRKPKSKLPPGPRKWPIIGNLHLLSGSAMPQHTLRELAKKYGPLMHIKLGEVHNLVVSSAEAAIPFLKTHDVAFASRPSLMTTEICCYGNTDIALAPYGEYWRQLRRISMVELLSNKRVESFRHVREEEVSDICRWIARHEGSAVNLSEKLRALNYDIMARAVLGKKTDEQARIIELLKEGLKLNSVFNISEVFPSLRFLCFGTKRMIQEYHWQQDEICQNIIDQRRRENAERSDDRDDDDDDHDMLDVLLRLQTDGSLEIPLTDDNVKAVLMGSLGAGVAPLTAAIDWAMAEILRNPNVLKTAQDEVRKVFDAKEGVDERYFDELKYLKLVIKETLRLHPPAPLLLRECRERCEINRYVIPARTRVLVNAWAIARDPEYWDDADSFSPQRFIEKPIDFNTTTLEYIPFGAGRRSCPGISFGITNVELQLAMLLYHFDWVVPHGVDMAEFYALSAGRKQGISAIPIVKRPLPEQRSF